MKVDEAFTHSPNVVFEEAEQEKSHAELLSSCAQQRQKARGREQGLGILTDGLVTSGTDVRGDLARFERRLTSQGAIRSVKSIGSADGSVNATRPNASKVSVSLGSDLHFFAISIKSKKPIQFNPFNLGHFQNCHGTTNQIDQSTRSSYALQTAPRPLRTSQD